MKEGFMEFMHSGTKLYEIKNKEQGFFNNLTIK